MAGPHFHAFPGKCVQNTNHNILIQLQLSVYFNPFLLIETWSAMTVPHGLLSHSWPIRSQLLIIPTLTTCDTTQQEGMKCQFRLKDKPHFLVLAFSTLHHKPLCATLLCAVPTIFLYASGNCHPENIQPMIIVDLLTCCADIFTL